MMSDKRNPNKQWKGAFIMRKHRFGFNGFDKGYMDFIMEFAAPDTKNDK